MRIPSTQALRALDSFARHGSVWRAADELHLTRSAVSHQLRLLERDLGFDLLQRIGKGVALTPRGQRYASDVRKALTVLGDAGTQTNGAGVGGSFAISCPPGFASMFLCTHIGEFQQMYPDVALSVLTPRRLDDVSNPDADAFIAFGVGNWPNRAVELLCEVSFMPLCSPTLLNKVGGFAKPADVLRANLLHLSDTEDWARWLALSKVENPDTEGGIFFSDMNLVFSAAIAGQGIALGDELLGRRALSEGRLVKPFEASVPSPRAYFLVFEHAKAGHPVLNAFSDWLRAKLSENRVANY
ncbi:MULTISPECIES: LysR substrate-binding domain-containing protein [unclassified Mesorhizobium]|uniref:LysR substrate-binding domain-containing protein n=1 Tax=unclassified Mesorhizobium TaxID=325217 RepID=UPI000FCABF8A|nr:MULTISPECIES: LysR substrate-binding domain-containing protein [unclassified Mesorhizobium]TGP21793.1 LysR family transcriptional regulator [Mesorhizobium sp. M1D.F.Ca.ET.231.01.1.1]TGP29893.1 LysR family transcriptional regulator [Mesorhizobium sp. M1D.F.Ca.ET.234.01.1.1]TGS44258.1 LysR family transcriptional regulator [Mesorhizobium sp. M1D.F.Ca.ET.184.01.1.1]TGS60275.1 LysR family transcriptional regulator [Mesorhizobium sp. M1D.F.Ca.ET.183.01.1.1]